MSKKLRHRTLPRGVEDSRPHHRALNLTAKGHWAAMFFGPSPVSRLGTAGKAIGMANITRGFEAIMVGYVIRAPLHAFGNPGPYSALRSPPARNAVGGVLRRGRR